MPSPPPPLVPLVPFLLRFSQPGGIDALVVYYIDSGLRVVDIRDDDPQWLHRPLEVGSQHKPTEMRYDQAITSASSLPR
ncbi:hypothetical protein P175DRAFT_0556259 [Aspergillus ochraceoroseus IBT 24754]|uniref:Uncharacterized protein n=1 Tax=Aspergillus ochraceoroseus IBT 24754 TaxID=1392256 RepID=A0A2T5M520_9EURO|nr:uncharacterized protein P175DRAFT_0556259 [Aspergillus ochraceoroseus IBT 24754]PTU23622.1 hypothetical protein P175DRAFT_0556259 [Aspergillus ochraceoroseus IBT 24754]